MGRFGTVASCLFASIGGLAACGDDGTPVVPDAPPEDAAPDASPDAPPGPISVTAYNHYDYTNVQLPKIPQAGVTVLVITPTGAAGPTATTGSDGKAMLEGVVAGSSLFALYPIDNGGNYYATAVVGVKPGDALVFGDNYWVRTGGTSVGMMDVAFPDPPAGTTHVAIRMPCWGSNNETSVAGSIPIQIYDSCASAMEPILLFTLNSNVSNAPTAYGYLTNAPYTAGSTATLAAWTPVTMDNIAVSATGIASEVATMRMYARSVFGPSTTSFASANPTLVGGAATAAFTLPGTNFLVTALFDRNVDGTQVTAKPGTSPFAFTNPTLPWIDSVTATGATAEAAWTTSGGTAPGDVAVLTLQFSRSDGKNSHQYYWNVVMPPDRRAFSLGAAATVPAALAPYLPESTAEIQPQLRLIDLSAVSDYDGARNTPEWELLYPEAAISLDGRPSISFSDGGEGYAVICPIGC